MTLIDNMPDVEVTAPALTPYPFGLFSFAPDTLDVRAAGGGVWWRSLACGQGVGVTFAPCQVDDEVPELDVNVACAVSRAASFTVYARSDEVTVGDTLERKFARAKDVLIGGEQFAVEQALWALLQTATAAPTGFTADHVQTAVALAEAHARKVYGGTPVIHVSPFTATQGPFAFHAEGQRMRTMLGTPVIVGGGYGGDDLPADESGDVIVTGALVVHRGETFDLGQVFDRKVNNIAAVVERTYVVGWDCFAARIEYAAA